MALGQILPGNLILADDLQDEIDELTWRLIRKPIDGSFFPSTTTLANDEDLLLTVTARSYLGEAMIYYAAGTTANLKLAWTFPAAFTFDYSADSLATGGGTTFGEVVSKTEASGTSRTFGGAGLGSERYVHYRMSMTFSSAGTLRLQRAQGTSTAENTVIKAGSWLTLQPT